MVAFIRNTVPMNVFRMTGPRQVPYASNVKIFHKLIRQEDFRATALPKYCNEQTRISDFPRSRQPVPNFADRRPSGVFMKAASNYVPRSFRCLEILLGGSPDRVLQRRRWTRRVSRGR